MYCTVVGVVGVDVLWFEQSAKEQTYYVLGVKEVALDDLLDLLD